MSYGAIPNVQFTINGGQFPPHGLITDVDSGPYAVVVTWMFASISMLAVAVRILTRRSTNCADRDGLLITAAEVAAVGQSIATHLAVHYGLGRHINTLSQSNLDSYGKSVYASEILSITVFCLSKFSLTFVFRLITPSERIHLALMAMDIFILLWGVAATFALAFQCGPPTPWAMFGQSCVNESTLLVTNGVINTTTDTVLMLFPVFIMWNVNVKPKQRVIVLVMFWVRILVCVSNIVQLVVVRPYLTGIDQSWNYLWFSFWNQITVHLSVICACIPFLKPFFDRLQSSLANSSTYPASKPFYVWGGLVRSSRQSGKRSSLGATGSLMRNTGLVARTENTIEGGLVRRETSQTGLTEDAILQTREIDIESRNASSRSRSRTSS